MIHIDQIVRSKRRTLALIVMPDGRVVVRAPLGASDQAIRTWVETKADWLKARLAAVPPRETFAEGRSLWYLGQACPLRLVDAARPALTFREGVFYLGRGWLPQAEAVFTRWYRAQAARVLGARLAQRAKQLGYPYRRLRISAARTRWGSCSSSGTISLTWRLVMAPPEVADYVIVHELVHTRHPNHSPAFWAQVAAHLPDYRQRAQWLKSQGAKLALPRGESPYN